MVFCTVTAMGKSMTCQMPVLNHQNKAIPNPNAMDVNTAMMRCLVKTISLFGIGLYIYAGEDLPDEEAVDLTEAANEWCEAIAETEDLESLKEVFTRAYSDLKQDKNAVEMIAKAKDDRKAKL
jgi:hypothetical protein